MSDRKIVIAVPCMDMVQTGFFGSCLALVPPEGFRVEWKIRQSSLIYDSRNELSRMAIESGAEWILWLDSDMTFDPLILRRLLDYAQGITGCGYMSAIYFSRKQPIQPVIYRGAYLTKDDDGKEKPVLEVYDNIFGHGDTVIEIAASGLGVCLISAEMIKAVAERFGLPFSPRLGFGEDISFCIMARELGYKLYAAPGITAGHIGCWTITADIYEAMQQAREGGAHEQ